ncbi:MAG TPA: NAD(P)/FAD-dependent oxidoreductase [Patescibacteria group bacterium]|nr:NAD(P)/FAD-dependent oxidoreductase [Patescibacteria group bacterium]
MTQRYDVIILGAGAAGLMAAIEAGKRGKRVIVLEKSAKPAEKIRISGGGRCNFTNIYCAPDRFISQNPHFCKSALARYTPRDFIAMVDRHNIKWREKKLGQLFCDGSSTQIIDMLLRACADAGVQVRLETEITKVAKTEQGFSIQTTGGSYECGAVVVATGGPSIPKMGATGFAYDIARQFGLKVVPPRPALVPLTFTDDTLSLTRDLSGVAVDPARVSCDGTSFDEAILFTHRGLSGPAILQISSFWREGREIAVDLAPGRDVPAMLRDARMKDARKSPATVLGEIVPQRLADKIIARHALGSLRMADLPDEKLHMLAADVKDWRLLPNGTEGYRTAEVTAGGVDTDELSSQTFAARKVPGLYFIGECIDVTGWLGGYNFQWAWASGWCCGQAV